MRVRFAHARSQAEALLSRYRIAHPPVDVVHVANQLGVAVLAQELDADVSGLLVSGAGGSSIVVNEGHHRNRRRFTIAHELGHHVLEHRFEPGDHVHVDRGHYISYRNPRSSEAVDPKEIEANQFASTLLMPRRLVVEAVDVLGAPHLVDYQVHSLAQTFEVSEQAMTIRLGALKLL